MNKDKLILFSGPASTGLGNLIARYLNQPLGWIQVNQFSDGETSIEIAENIRGKHIFLIQSTYQPGNEHLMQLLLMADACKRASAESISAVVPYFGYSRQDRRPRNTRGPVSAKLVANLIETAGIQRLITVDLHADQIEGFFSIPVDNIYSSQILLSDIWKKRYQDPVIVSPDVGGVLRARAIARRLDSAGLAIIDKRREAANKSEVMNIIGDVDGKTTILFDDMVDTAGTLCNAASALKEKGAIKTVAYAAHPVLSGPAIERIAESNLDELVVTDTIPLSEEAKAIGKIRQLSIAEILGETIQRMLDDQSVSSLYAD
ncbi:MAG: ribose-phosphate pyrophosphokinase [Gammaproteobacteria bacterium]|nr:ribose-phosphate pyrophosphokinase [Gammaproteobacteria bacterium]